VLIYGAGRGGALVVRELLENRTLDLMPVGFLDDDPAKRRVKVEGLPVLGRLEDLRTILGSRAVSEVLVSIAHLDRNRLGRLASICREHNVKVRAMRLALEEIGPVPHVHHESHAS
jgi:UDP-GlcNAc:undecaprenyl-phosphate GlcNAc-1-phosphate transferase